MHWKQWLTLGCAVATVGMGACFQAPYHPPKPPLARGMTMRIVVADTSATHAVDTLAVAALLASRFRSEDGVVPVVGEDPGPVDAVLNVTVSKEQIEKRSCYFVTKTVLSTPDGRVLRQESRSIRCALYVGDKTQSDAELWQSAVNQRIITQELGNELFFYLHRSQ